MTLELAGVDAGYGNTVVLRDVDLVVPDGTVVALLGANGAGKTTMLRVASGAMRPRCGRLLVDGQDVTGYGPDTLARLGICHVPEGRAIFPSLSVRENLRLFGADPSGPDPVEHAIGVLPRLARLVDRVSGSLSGGEQQLLALARTVTARPRFVLLDEVSMGLAPQVVDEIFGFLEELARGGAALLLVEQYVQRALALADVVYVLQRGRIEFCGEPAEIDAADLAARYLAG